MYHCQNKHCGRLLALIDVHNVSSFSDAYLIDLERQAEQEGATQQNIENIDKLDLVCAHCLQRPVKYVSLEEYFMSGQRDMVYSQEERESFAHDERLGIERKHEYAHGEGFYD